MDKAFYDSSRFYNPNLKVAFLERYEGKTKTTYANVFYHSEKTERTLRKDLAEFTLEEIENVIRDMQPMTVGSASSFLRTISSYITFALKELDDTLANINPLEGNLPEGFIENTVDKSKKLFISKVELDGIISNLVNYQDKVLMSLIFERGVFGTGGSEILNLKKQDIDFKNNILHVKDDELGERDVEVSPECIALISGALNEPSYKAKNGQSEGRNSERPLIENDYVLRNAKTRSEHNNRADKHLIYRRVSMISDESQIPYLTSKNIERSGQIFYVYKQIKEGKYTEINNDLLKEIGDKFGMKKSMINGEMNYNFYLMREYINPEVITSLYDDIEL